MPRFPEVRGYIEQLIAHGFLRQTDDAFPVVMLTEVGRRADEGSLRPHPDLVLRSPAASGEGPSGGSASRIEADSWQDVDRDLFERLRTVRLEIARARGVPPYVIFHDTTLREMARVRPTHGRTARHPRHWCAKGRGPGRNILAAIRGA